MAGVKSRVHRGACGRLRPRLRRPLFQSSPNPPNSPGASEATPIAGVAGHGVQLAHLDQSVDPGQDFYRYATGAWQDRNEIPPDEASWGAYDQVIDLTRTQLIDVLRALRRVRLASGRLRRVEGGAALRASQRREDPQRARHCADRRGLGADRRHRLARRPLCVPAGGAADFQRRLWSLLPLGLPRLR